MDPGGSSQAAGSGVVPSGWQVTTQVIEPGAYAFASSTNVLDGTARSLVDGDFAVYHLPSAFLRRVKNVLLSMGTTEVYR